MLKFVYFDVCVKTLRAHARNGTNARTNMWFAIFKIHHSFLELICQQCFPPLSLSLHDTTKRFSWDAGCVEGWDGGSSRVNLNMSVIWQCWAVNASLFKLH